MIVALGLIVLKCQAIQGMVLISSLFQDLQSDEKLV